VFDIHSTTISVFISYARINSDIEFVNHLEVDLKKRGLRTWVDRSKLEGGQSIDAYSSTKVVSSFYKPFINWVLIAVAILFTVGCIVVYTVTNYNPVAIKRSENNNPQEAIVNSAATFVALENDAYKTATAYTHSSNATAYASAIANNANPYSPYTGSLIINDPLSHPVKWKASSGSVDNACQFSQGKYHIHTSQFKRPFGCLAQNLDFSNMVFEVKLMFVKGDCGGLLFRSGNTVGQFYALKVCQDGSYDLSIYKDGTDANAIVLKDYSSSIINKGANQSNTIAIVANGGSIDIYINTEKVDSLTDNTYSHGQIGLLAEALSTPTEMAFSIARVWRL
jgi:hypothetical protein